MDSHGAFAVLERLDGGGKRRRVWGNNSLTRAMELMPEGRIEIANERGRAGLGRQYYNVRDPFTPDGRNFLGVDRVVEKWIILVPFYGENIFNCSDSFSLWLR